MAVQLQRKTTPLDAWHLSDAVAMMEAFAALSALGWRGGVTTGASGDLRLEMSLTNAPGITAEIGDWLIDDLGVRKMTAADISANYDEVTP